MSVDVRIVEVASTPFAAVRAHTDRAGLGKAIVASLDPVYTLLRAREVAGLGHNVVVYPSFTETAIEILAGVQTPSPIAPEGAVVAAETPAGRAATAAYFGPYDQMHSTHAAIQRHLAAQGLRSDVSWEVYGDWSDDPAKLRTEIYYRIAERPRP
ncbi:MAG TPA: GyrI-like domain-containing protein [Caulobacteraceae bacterium]|nr:GyrI-like domain-containing protein [Caulobacteraceae bacterium]